MKYLTAPSPDRPQKTARRANRPTSEPNVTSAARSPADPGVAEPEEETFPAAPEHPLVEFTLAVADAREVAVAGTFNHWNPNSCPLEKGPNGTWSAEIPVPRGRLEYRFIVDGSWTDDPAAAQTVPNPYGSLNAVLEV